MSAEDPEPRTAADARLDEHLQLLRTDDFEGGALAHRIARRARWQAAIRVPLRAAASLLGAAAQGLATLIGTSRRPR